MNTSELWVDDRGMVKHRDRHGRENTWSQDEAEQLCRDLARVCGHVEERSFVQIAGVPSHGMIPGRVLAVFTDGTAWFQEDGKTWQQIAPPRATPSDDAKQGGV